MRVSLVLHVIILVTDRHCVKDSSSSALSRVLHVLCLHPDRQARLRQEVSEARAAGNLDYDKLMALRQFPSSQFMPNLTFWAAFLDAIVRETLRL